MSEPSTEPIIEAVDELERYAIHPAADLFPRMQTGEWGKLIADIEANGLLEPITLWDGKILDGRNRLRACDALGISPKFEDRTADISSPVQYVISKNLYRRHLSSTQRAAVAAAMVPMLAAEAKTRQGRRTDLEPETSRSIDRNVGEAAKVAADAMNVGEATVRRALRVKREDPEVFERLQKGEISVHKAQQSLPKSRLDKPETNKLASKIVPGHVYSNAKLERSKVFLGLINIKGDVTVLSEEISLNTAIRVCDNDDVERILEACASIITRLTAFSEKIQKASMRPKLVAAEKPEPEIEDDTKEDGDSSEG